MCIFSQSHQILSNSLHLKILGVHYYTDNKTNNFTIYHLAYILLVHNDKKTYADGTDMFIDINIYFSEIK